MAQFKGFYRSRTDRILGGVAGGLADSTGINTGTMRLLFVLSLLLPGPQMLIYIAAWILLPERD